MTRFKRILSAVFTAAMLGSTGTAALAAGAKIFVVGGKPDDPFWSVVKRGAEDAGKLVTSQGGSVTWLGPQNYDNLGVDAAELVRQAIQQGATAVVGPDWVPEAMDPAFRAVVDAKIPLIIYNAGGIKAADRLGALNYVGSDDYKVGVAAGEYFAEKGEKNLVCVNSLPGAANIEAYCHGMTDGIKGKGGVGATLPLPATAFGNSTAVAQAVKAYLLQHPDVVGVFTIGDTFNHKASSGLRYILNPPGTQARVHQHLNIGQGEVPWDAFFGTLAEIGFDGIMTSCVFAWEDKADQSGTFMRAEMQRYVDKYWKRA